MPIPVSSGDFGGFVLFYFVSVYWCDLFRDKYSIYISNRFKNVAGKGSGRLSKAFIIKNSIGSL